MKKYEEFFNHYKKLYNDNNINNGIISEVDFIENEIYFDKSIKIVDIGKGPGRHSIELAKRGYNVLNIGFPYSIFNKESILSLNKMDEKNFIFNKNEFDLAIIHYEEDCSLREEEELNFIALSFAESLLNNKGKLIFTTLNGLFPLFNTVKNFIVHNAEKGISKELILDLLELQDISFFDFFDENEIRDSVICYDRSYIPSEIAWLLKSLNFSKIDILSCKRGDWSRINKLTTEDYEMLIIAEK
ncbi:MAG: class I SAM-dependent methyltransferase [Spirochaetes bacterium]|nr:class I SAM-dependent methyltransferase [Spirochaetota bacterium]